jgi:hypothetical protein
MPVRFDNGLTAFEFGSGDGGSEALLCRRTKATKRVVREWCELNEIEVTV